MINRTWLEKQNVHIFHHFQYICSSSSLDLTEKPVRQIMIPWAYHIQNTFSLGNDTIPRCRKTFGSSLSTRDCVAKFLFSSEQFITYFGLPNSVCKFPPSLIEMHIRVGAAAVLASLRY